VRSKRRRRRSAARKRASRDPRKTALFLRLQRLWERLQARVDADWDRTLPLGDYFVDRFDKARRLGFGPGSSIYDSSLVIGKVSVGEKTWIGPFTVLDGSGGLEIGSYCSISAGVQIYTHDTVRWALSAGASGPERAPTCIGSRCYIGPGTVIGPGVTIGDGCIIGASSLVLHDIPSGSRAYGTPCRVVGTVEDWERRHARDERTATADAWSLPDKPDEGPPSSRSPAARKPADRRRASEPGSPRSG
jgi:acetyltransferase-like isoleucine patch superfamily enzyme